MANRPGPILRILLRLPVFLFRWRLGRLLGHRFLLLVHTGRRTGIRHETVLEVLHSDAQEITVLSGWGTDADWFRNVTAGGPTDVLLGRRRHRVSCRVLQENEAAEVLAHYEENHRCTRPIFRRAVSARVGWMYDGSESSRRRLVHELPLVAFRDITP